MLQYAVRRLLIFIPLLLLLTLITYAMSYFGPGDPLRIMMGENWQSEEVYNSLREQYGLNRPFLVQFADYVWHALQGDFGRSFIQRTEVGEMIGRALPISAQLAFVAILQIAVLGIGLGIIAALWHHRWPDVLIGLFGVITHSVPTFVIPPILLVILVLKLQWISTPTGWHGILSHQTFIAALVMSAGPLLGVIRQTRTAVLEVMQQDYVRTARAKGLREWQVMGSHVLRNALSPVLTSLGLTFGYLLGGSIFVESAFAIPGLGGLFYSALRTTDYPLLTAATIVSAAWIMLMSLVVDLFYAVLDPRIRYK